MLLAPFYVSRVRRFPQPLEWQEEIMSRRTSGEEVWGEAVDRR